MPGRTYWNVIELRRSGNLQVSITMSKYINGRLKPFRYSLPVYIDILEKSLNSMTLGTDGSILLSMQSKKVYWKFVWSDDAERLIIGIPTLSVGTIKNEDMSSLSRGLSSCCFSSGFLIIFFKVFSGFFFYFRKRIRIKFH